MRDAAISRIDIPFARSSIHESYDTSTMQPQPTGMTYAAPKLGNTRYAVEAPITQQNFTGMRNNLDTVKQSAAQSHDGHEEHLGTVGTMSDSNMPLAK